MIFHTKFYFRIASTSLDKSLIVWDGVSGKPVVYIYISSVSFIQIFSHNFFSGLLPLTDVTLFGLIIANFCHFREIISLKNSLPRSIHAKFFKSLICVIKSKKFCEFLTLKFNLANINPNKVVFL